MLPRNIPETPEEGIHHQHISNNAEPSDQVTPDTFSPPNYFGQLCDSLSNDLR